VPSHAGHSWQHPGDDSHPCIGYGKTHCHAQESPFCRLDSTKSFWLGKQTIAGENVMRLKVYIVTVLLATTLLSGCMVFGKNKEFQPFESTELDQLVPGETTATEVTEIFGAPSKVVELANGNAYVYKRTVTKGTICWLVLLTFGNVEKQHDQLVFFFDLEDTLTHYGLSLDADKAEYGFPD
jgi:outer membrane protein assembly factor BamE (lipoprotein component of BamABCDE complex)